MRALSLVLLATVACTDVEDPHNDEEQEVITTVILTFSPTGGGADVVASWDDPENDGSPVIDPISLSEGVDYSLAVAFENRLEDPPEDITQEVADEAEEHQVFFTGTGVRGPATGSNATAVVEHAYADTDANGLPIGLENTITTLTAGSGELTVTLRHLPEEGGEAVKGEDLADDVATGGFSAIGGDNDAQVTFSIDVE